MVSSEHLTVGIAVGTQPPLRRVGVTLRAARAAGFDVAWTVDHFQGFYPQAIWDRDFSFLADPESTPHAYFDFQALTGYLARRAGRMHLGVGVTEPVRRHPVLLAQWAMTLAHMTKRTPILGMGAGEAENVTPYGLDFSAPVSRLEEALAIIRECFTSRGPFDFAGDQFPMSGAMMDLRPPKGHTPQIWVAAHRPRMLRLTGKYGDGWYPTLPYTPQSYADAVEVIRTAATAAGRRPRDIVPGWQLFVILGKDEAAARRLLAARAIRFAALLAPDSMWREHGAAHPLGEGFRGLVDFVPQHYDRAELDAAMAKVPVDLVAETALWGTPDSVYEELRDFVDAGLRHVVFAPVSALVSKSDAAFSLRSMVSLARRLRRDGV
jgi:phthiodiolone/phenolphthiodiolone dimycocerosates ketoreductase